MRSKESNMMIINWWGSKERAKEPIHKENHSMVCYLPVANNQLNKHHWAGKASKNCEVSWMCLMKNNEVLWMRPMKNNEEKWTHPLWKIIRWLPCHPKKDLRLKTQLYTLCILVMMLCIPKMSSAPAIPGTWNAAHRSSMVNNIPKNQDSRFPKDMIQLRHM